ncbi:MAG TPA: hypothetical protein VLM11_19840 [Streptosporangiaceae bacterium]|nr:hypothetical protein [Streptosporangiaceae bacterium]
MTTDRGYASPAAFRRALTERLGALAKHIHGTQLVDNPEPLRA